MDILTFNKLTKPIYESEISIDCRPRAKWLVEVKRPDGTIRKPFGDQWIKNLFTNAFANGILGGPGNTQGWGFSAAFIPALTSMARLLYTYNATSPTTRIVAGSGSTAPSNSDTALQTFVKSTQTNYVVGNSISQSSTTGNIVYSVKVEFSAETGSATYREAGVEHETTANGCLGQTSGSNVKILMNRVVFPSNVNLVSGEQLILTLAVTIPTLAVTGQTITIAAQNGMNISGTLRCIGTSAAIVGGTVTANGVVTVNTDYPLLFNVGELPAAGLTTATTFPSFNTNSSGLGSNGVNGIWSSYTTNSRNRSVLFQWGSGVPVSNTDFRSITFRSRSGNTINGYQLLLNNQMTKATTATFVAGINFAI